MESDEARELEITLARAEAAPYLDYPDLPWWYPAVFAGWFAAIVAVLGHVGEWWAIFGTLALILVEIWFLRWFQAQHGAMPWPGKGNPPAEIARAYRAYYVGAVLVVVAVALTWLLAGHWPAVVATFVLGTAGFWWYDVRYEAVAQQVRERLA